MKQIKMLTMTIQFSQWTDILKNKSCSKRSSYWISTLKEYVIAYAHLHRGKMKGLLWSLAKSMQIELRQILLEEFITKNKVPGKILLTCLAFYLFKMDKKLQIGPNNRTNIASQKRKINMMMKLIPKNKGQMKEINFVKNRGMEICR